MIRRLFRLVLLAGAAAGVVAAVRALTGQKDPLPSPATPADQPWPPLRDQAEGETAPPTPTPTPATPPPTGAPAEAVPVAPEPDGVPIATPAGTGSYVEPTADGECPDGFPIKANMKSKIFHAPGQLNYDRTAPDRCYADSAAAEADGLRAAKR